MFLPLVPSLLGSHLLIAATGALPAVDTEKMCRDSATALYAASSTTNAIDNCMSAERAARDQLVKEWATFPPSAKARCVLPAEYLPSYTEWLTCLQMDASVRKIREQPDKQAAPVAAGSRTAGQKKPKP